MKNLQWTATKEDEGIRLDAFLAQKSGETRSRIQNLLKEGHVACNGRAPKKAGQAVEAGDEIALSIPDPEPLAAVPVEMDIPIVYEDADIVVVNKPRNLVTHPAAGHAQDTLVNALLFACDDLSGIGGKFRPGIVHRLDKDTTGLLVVAKNDAAHLDLAEQIRVHSAGRVYWALVEGRIREENGTVDAPIGRNPRDRKKMAVVPDGRPAVTHFRVLQAFSRTTLIECRLVTGRTHQIRVHMASLGHPVCGDPLYGFAKSAAAPCPLMLHARELHIRHPRTGEEQNFVAEPPQDFLRVLERQR
ncbi:MAG: RluA family pseudouridine synthase [Candidatus Spyradocola sp.]|jgi:23S rRNA pseudouridine1911/1915/1917 synthase